jgi:signal transduction histidine kinase
MQVLMNLLSNAVKCCAPDSGRVRIDIARVDGGKLRLRVIDNGIGIPRQDQARIFEKFRQSGDGPAAPAQGFGLGLPISRLIVRQFGGDLWVESEPGQGATFSFTLPIADVGLAGAAP